MSDPTAQIVELEVKLAEHVREFVPKIRDADMAGSPNSGSLGHYNYKLPSYLLAHLYQLDHPANTLKGQDWCAESAMELVDLWEKGWRIGCDEGHSITTSEWPVYATLGVIKFLGDRVDERREADWLEFLEHYCKHSLAKPFGFTSPNHEAWRVLGLYAAGQDLNKPDWCDTALFFAHRLIDLQTTEGFWEEGVHHGPSMRYSCVMLAGLAILYRLSGDVAVGEACRRHADFLATYTFPDATTIGAFDGRQSTSTPSFAPIIPGQELSPIGRTLNARGLQVCREIGCYDDARCFSNSLWYFFFGSMFFGAACHYFLDMLPEEERAKAITEDKDLPVDVDGTIENHTTTLDGLVHRRGPWALALSSQNSDVPKDQGSVYRLDRQSRIELWHQDARLVVGGGHSRKDMKIPLANVVVDTGHAGPARFGIVQYDRNQARRRYHLPRVVQSEVVDGQPTLKVIFAHAVVKFRFDLKNDRQCIIRAGWDARHVQRLCLQLPVIVWRGATVTVDGERIPSGATATVRLEKELAAIGGVFASDLKLTIPKHVPCRVHYPLSTLQVYGGTLAPDEDETLPPFAMALVSCQWEKPEQTGEARFKLTL